MLIQQNNNNNKKSKEQMAQKKTIYIYIIVFNVTFLSMLQKAHFS